MLIHVSYHSYVIHNIDNDIEVCSLCLHPHSDFHMDSGCRLVKTVLPASLSVCLHITFAQNFVFHQKNTWTCLKKKVVDVLQTVK